MEVDHHHRKALASVGLRIPAIAPAIAEAALRAAVDQERHRILLACLVVRRLDHIAVDRLAIPADEIELLEVAPGDFLQLRLVVVAELARIGAVGLGREQLARAAHRVAHEHQGVAVQVEAANGAGAGNAGGLATDQVKGEQRMLAVLRRLGVDPAAVIGQHDRIGRHIPARIQLAAGAGGKVHGHQRETVGLETGALHRPVVQGLAVAAEYRAGIPGLVRRGQVHRRRVGGDRRAEQVEVGGPRFALASDPRAVDDRTAVGRPGELIDVAEGLGGHVAVHAAGNPRRLAGQLAASPEPGDEQLVAPAIGPGVPMADEGLVENHATSLVRALVVEALLAAGQGRAIAEDLHHQGHRFAIRGQLECIDVHREIGKPHRLAAGNGFRPQLHGARLGAQEIHGQAIRRCRRTVDVESLRCETRRLGAVDALDPEASDALVCRVIGLADRVDHLASASHQHRRGDPVEVGQVAHLERARRAGLQGKDRGDQRGQEQVAKVHGCTRG